MELLEVAFLLMVAVGAGDGDALPAFAPLGSYADEQACTEAAARVRAALTGAGDAAEPFCVSTDDIRSFLRLR